jgi:hypothetical protein
MQKSSLILGEVYLQREMQKLLQENQQRVLISAFRKRKMLYNLIKIKQKMQNLAVLKSVGTLKELNSLKHVQRLEKILQERHLELNLPIYLRHLLRIKMPVLPQLKLQLAQWHRILRRNLQDILLLF